MKTTMTKIQTIGALILGLGLLTTPAWSATDYSSLTNEEIAAMRGTMRTSSQEDRDAFQTEWQARVNSMSTEERNQAVGRPDNAARDGEGYKNGNGGGRGQGRGSNVSSKQSGSYGGGMGRGSSMGGGRGGGRR